MVYILHIDTSGDTGTVALAADGKTVSVRINTDTRNHAATINIHIDEVIKEAGIILDDVSAIAVCGGPGSYTGLRIGLATAKGLCYTLDKPLLLHNKLVLLTVNQYYKFLNEYEYYISILPAREKEYFISKHDNKLQCIIEPRHIFEDELGKLLTETDKKTMVVGVPFHQIELNSNLYYINSQSIIIDSWSAYSFEEYNCNRIVNLSNAEPFYLKDVYTHKKQ